MPLISRKIDLYLAWSPNCVLSGASNQATTFAIVKTRLNVPILTLRL